MRGSETILVVEDDDLVRSTVLAILRRKGYLVLEANGGAEALARSEHGREEIALLLTDVVMPTMGGRELAERMSSIRPGMKILYMSGYTGDSVLRQTVLELGVPFIQKPFTSEELARKVREVLDGTSASACA
jgi:two-component system cell cycle sensor histidine kinase/response regulator CckA